VLGWESEVLWEIMGEGVVTNKLIEALGRLGGCMGVRRRSGMIQSRCCTIQTQSDCSQTLGQGRSVVRNV
jgi:hypothetical protein